MLTRRFFLARSSLVGLGCWGLGTPLLWGFVWPKPLYAADYPYPMGSFLVSTASELREALSRHADAGIHIVLKPGTYSGDFTAAHGGTKEHPLVIRSQEPLGAKINGRIDLAGQNTIAHGLVLDNGRDYAMEIAGDGNKVLRSHFVGPRGVSLTNGTRNYHIGNNLFDGDSYASPRNSDEHRQYQVYVKVKGGEGSPPEPGLIEGNHFLDRYAGEVAENHAVYVGDSYDPDSEPLDLLIQYNLLGTPEEPYERRRGVYVKRGCKIHFNQANMGRGTFGIRHGNGGEMVGNNLEGKMLATVNGNEHKVIGNRWRCKLFALNCTHRNGSGGGPDGKGNQYQAANDCLTEGNDGDVTVGYMVRGGSLERKVGGVNVRGHNGQVIREQEEGTILGDGDAGIQAISLTPADVGPDAASNPDRTPAAFRTIEPEGGIIIPDDPGWKPGEYGKGYIRPESMRRMNETTRQAPSGVRMHSAPTMPDVDLDLDALFRRGT